MATKVRVDRIACGITCKVQMSALLSCMRLLGTRHGRPCSASPQHRTPAAGGVLRRARSEAHPKANKLVLHGQYWRGTLQRRCRRAARGRARSLSARSSRMHALSTTKATKCSMQQPAGFPCEKGWSGLRKGRGACTFSPGLLRRAGGVRTLSLYLPICYSYQAAAPLR